jgi:ADP-heptose:LPS heptosyltransferase
MNVGQARKVDRWVGVPLCFLASIAHHVFRVFRIGRQCERVPVKKVAFIKLSELGAIILAYPLVNRIKREYPSAELFFVTFERNRDVFKVQGDLVPEKNVLIIRETPLCFVLDIIKAINRLRREKIDIVFDLEFFSRLSALCAYLACSGKRVGFYRYTFEGLYRGDLLTHRVQYNPLCHIAQNYLSLSQAAGGARKTTPELAKDIDDADIVFPKHVSDAATKTKLLGKLKERGVTPGKHKIFLINPGEGMLPLREWPLDNFVALSRLILRDEGHCVVMTGTDSAARKAGALLEKVQSPRCVSMLSQTALDELLELFSLSEVLISNDCGLAHLGMLTPLKKFIIFGPESPRIFGPLGDNNWVFYSHWPCSPCLSVLNHRDSRCSDNICLKAITPEEVYEAVMQQVRREHE